MTAFITLASTKLGATLEIGIMLLVSFGLGYLFHWVMSRALVSRITNLENRLRHVTYRFESADAERDKYERNLKRLKTKYDRFKWEADQKKDHEGEWQELKLKTRDDAKRLVNLEKERNALQEQVDDLKVQLLQLNMDYAKVETPTSSEHRHDNLKLITGIGPKAEALLHEHEIFTYSQLARSSIKKLNEILSGQGKYYASVDPKDWKSAAKEIRASMNGVPTTATPPDKNGTKKKSRKKA